MYNGSLELLPSTQVRQQRPAQRQASGGSDKRAEAAAGGGG